MRCLPYAFVILSVAGCHSQGSPVVNPFLAPDRVPPPSTRTLLPGTAQPYYPGDPVPTTPTSPAPGATCPEPNTTVPPTYNPQSAPVTPPGGWGQPTPAQAPYNVQPMSSTRPPGYEPLDGQLVSVVPDNESLRFAPQASPGPGDILQVAAHQQTTSQNGYVYSAPQVTAPAPANSVQPADQAALLTATMPPGTASDGFRPQGSVDRSAGTQVDRPAMELGNSFRSPDADFYGYDPSYSWLRGQLQYFPQSGVWGLRYIPAQGHLDSLGGVAVIANPELLGALQPGEYLLVQGTLQTVPNGDGFFTPLYTVSGIQRQR